MQKLVPTETQSGKWDTCAFNSPICILRLPVTTGSPKRNRIMSNSVRLLNLRADVVGINQICIVRSDQADCRKPWVYRLIEEQASAQLNSSGSSHPSEYK